MATNLAGGGQCIGMHSVCVLRAAILDPDCTPQGGVNSGIVTVGIVTATITPEYRDERRLEPTTGCGDIAWSYSELGEMLRATISGELVYHDEEAHQVLFGGTPIIGRDGTGFPGKTIGWAPETGSGSSRKSVYLELITKSVSAEAGDCQVVGSEFPTYKGWVLPKATLNMGAVTLNDQAINVPFEGFSVKNPTLVRGPWNDYPGVGAIPVAPYFTVGYSQSEYEAILEDAGCGFVDLPITYSG